VSRTTLDDLAKLGPNGVFDIEFPVDMDMPLSEPLAETALENLGKLKRLGILSADAIMSIVGQAPIDPVNLMGTLMHHDPAGWVFSAIDFSMMRVLARNQKKAVSAAIRVDLMSNVIAGLALNKADQLTIFKTFAVEPGPDSMANIQRLCDETIEAAERETRP
jgi:hypothetical protein